MKTKLFLVVALVSVVLAVGILGVALLGCQGTRAVAADNQPVNINVNGQQGIWVNGQGKVTITPDIATLNLGVSARASTVAEAKSQAAAAMEKILSALTSQGVAKKDIQTQYFSIQQITRWNNSLQKEELDGFMVSNMVTAKIRNIENAGLVIDAVAAAGGDDTRINGIGFSVDKPEQYYAQARELAMKDARTKAEQLAKQAGVDLGSVTYVIESDSTPPTPYRAYDVKAEMAGSSVTPISAGEMDIILNVQVAYAIR